MTWIYLIMLLVGCTSLLLYLRRRIRWIQRHAVFAATIEALAKAAEDPSAYDHAYELVRYAVKTEPYGQTRIMLQAAEQSLRAGLDRRAARQRALTEDDL